MPKIPADQEKCRAFSASLATKRAVRKAKLLAAREEQEKELNKLRSWAANKFHINPDRLTLIACHRGNV